ncbi:hypothetical protein L7F22_052979 [Adiantum nelumboides]|nr:hypothetical protein [Adiantum nelumboides]MCO5598880.1 hypothetical protein [Adiantum nelumboides]
MATHLQTLAAAIDDQEERNMTIYETQKGETMQVAIINGSEPFLDKKDDAAAYFAMVLERDAKRMMKYKQEQSFSPSQDSNPRQLAAPKHDNLSHLDPNLMPTRTPPSGESSSSSRRSYTLPITTTKGGHYLVTLLIGGALNPHQPPISQTVVLDTASGITWVQCEPAKRSLPQTSPKYKPMERGTFKPIGCDDSRCDLLLAPNKGCDEKTNTCLFAEGYVDGTELWGTWGTDTVGLGSWEANDVPIGCATYAQSDNMDGEAGFLGLGRSTASISQTTSHGYLKLGSDDDSSRITWIRMLTSRYYPYIYFVPLVGLRVNHEQLPLDPSLFAMDSTPNQMRGVFIDSGTAVGRLILPVYIVFRDAIRGAMAQVGYSFQRGPGRFETCYAFDPDQKLERLPGLPIVELVFESQATLPLHTYNLFRHTGVGLWCLTFYPNEDQAEYVSVMGSIQMHGVEWTFDVPNQKMGFVSGACPS